MSDPKFHLSMKPSTSLVTVQQKFMSIALEKDSVKPADLKSRNCGIFHLLKTSFLANLFKFDLDFGFLSYCLDIFYKI